MVRVCISSPKKFDAGKAPASYAFVRLFGRFAKSEPNAGGNDDIVLRVAGNRLADILVEEICVGRHPTIELGCDTCGEIYAVIAGVTLAGARDVNGLI
jgi:hypothetical protein